MCRYKEIPVSLSAQVCTVYNESIGITNLCIVTALLATASVRLVIVQSSLGYPVLYGPDTDNIDAGWVSVQPDVLPVLDRDRPDGTVARGTVLGPRQSSRCQIVAPCLQGQNRREQENHCQRDMVEKWGVGERNKN